jgi:hypothetical protein
MENDHELRDPRCLRRLGDRGGRGAGRPERSEVPERCLQLSRLDTTEVLNNQQILFRTRGREYFLNSLPHPCPGLRRNSTLLFRTSIDLVCDVDVVTVVESMGWGLRPGASCGLGKFEPVDGGEVEQLRQAARGE